MKYHSLIHDAKMTEFLYEVSANHIDLDKKSPREDATLLLEELTEAELNRFFILSLSFFETWIEEIDFTTAYEKLKILLRTNMQIDKDILADEFKAIVWERISIEMQDLLNEFFYEYVDEKCAEESSLSKEEADFRRNESYE